LDLLLASCCHRFDPLQYLAQYLRICSFVLVEESYCRESGGNGSELRKSKCPKGDELVTRQRQVTVSPKKLNSKSNKATTRKNVVALLSYSVSILISARQVLSLTEKAI